MLSLSVAMVGLQSKKDSISIQVLISTARRLWNKSCDIDHHPHAK